MEAVPFTVSSKMMWNLNVHLFFTFFMTRNVEYFMCLLTIYTSSFKNCLFHSLTLWILSLVFWAPWKFFINTLLAKTFSHYVDCPFNLLTVFLLCRSFITSCFPICQSFLLMSELLQFYSICYFCCLYIFHSISCSSF
jgi:hypothetical protein